MPTLKIKPKISYKFFPQFQNTIAKLEMEEKKRNHLTLEVKHFIVQEKARKPRKSITDLIYDIIDINPEVVEENKIQKQSQITDFFR